MRCSEASTPEVYMRAQAIARTTYHASDLVTLTQIGDLHKICFPIFTICAHRVGLAEHDRNVFIPHVHGNTFSP